MRFVAKDIPLEQRRQWRILNPDGTPVDGEGHVVWADDETGEYEVCLFNEHGEHYLVGNVWDIQRPDGTLIDPRRWATEVRRGPIRVVPPGGQS